MVAAFDAVVAQPGHTPLQLKQYGIQRDWLLKSTVPQIETIKLTKGLIAPAAGESYMTILMGSQVCHLYPPTHILTCIDVCPLPSTPYVVVLWFVPFLSQSHLPAHQSKCAAHRFEQPTYSPRHCGKLY
jgi:hypothetical protein